MTPLEAADEMRELSGLLNAALEYLKAQTREYAEAEDGYRWAKANA